MDQKLTVVLLLYDRAPFTFRWMSYANTVKFPFHIIIADGSKGDVAEKGLVDKSKYPNISYEYVRYPYDKDVPTFYKKMYEAVSLVKTKYVIIADNDDIYFKDALIKAVEFLEKNDDYVAARGEIYDFQINKTDDSNQKEHTHGKMTGYRRIFTSPSNEAPTALERVRIFSEFSDSLWQDVRRAEKVKECFKILVESDVTDMDLIENMSNYLMVTCGKVYRGTGLYMLHQTHEDGLAQSMTKMDVFDWIMKPKWPEEISKTFNLIAKKISAIDKISTEYANNRIMQYYICYMIGKGMIKNRLERKIKINKSSKIAYLSHIFSKENKIRILIKKLYLKFANIREERKSNRDIESSPYYKDLMIVKNFLLNK